MSYADCLARISQIDSLISGRNSGWAAALASSSGTSLADQSLASGSTFSSVLEGLVGTYASTSAPAAAAAATATATAAPASAASSAPAILSGLDVSSTTSKSSGSVSVQGSAPLTTPAIGFTEPLAHARLTQAFGPTTETIEHSATVDGVYYPHYHAGIDLARGLGTPVHAAADGTVVMAGKESDGAVVVEIRHDDGYETMYGHLEASLPVKVGDRVSAGDVIGNVGMTGHTTGPHLHFGLFAPDGKAVDPSPYLAAGALPDPATVLGPKAGDPSELTKVSGTAAIDHFDAISSQIPYAAQIRSAALANGIDPTLLASLVDAESGFNASAVSSSGAQGLTQLMPDTAASLGVTNPLDPQQSIDGGAKYLARQLKHFHRVDRALAAYNAGPSAVASSGGVPDSAKAYVGKILTTWSSYQEPVS